MTFSQWRVVRIVRLFIALSFTFLKLKEPVCLKVCTLEFSWKWDFPTFKAFISNVEIRGLPLPKEKKKEKKIRDPAQRKKNLLVIYIYF